MNDQLYQWRGIPAALSWRDRAPAAAERARHRGRGARGWESGVRYDGSGYGWPCC